MGPDGKGTAQAAVYIDGQPVQYAGEITLPERAERPAPPLLASMGFTMEQANEAASYLAEAFRVFCEQLEEAARAVAVRAVSANAAAAPARNDRTRLFMELLPFCLRVFPGDRPPAVLLVERAVGRTYPRAFLSLSKITKISSLSVESDCFTSHRRQCR